MKHSITNQVFNHLEFLGYKVEDLSENKEIDFLIWRSENRSNLILKVTKSWTIIITARYNLSEPNIVIKDLLNQLNIVNSQSFFTKRYYEKGEEEEITLVIETFTIDYNKHVFWTVIDTMESEIINYIKDFSK